MTLFLLGVLSGLLVSLAIAKWAAWKVAKQAPAIRAQLDAVVDARIEQRAREIAHAALLESERIGRTPPAPLAVHLGMRDGAPRGQA